MRCLVSLLVVVVAVSAGTLKVHKRKTMKAASIYQALRVQGRDTLLTIVNPAYSKLVTTPSTKGDVGNKFVGQREKKPRLLPSLTAFPISRYVYSSVYNNTVAEDPER